jgi:hypothetical protein
METTAQSLSFDKIRFQYYPAAVWKIEPLGTPKFKTVPGAHKVNTKR